MGSLPLSSSPVIANLDARIGPQPQVGVQLQKGMQYKDRLPQTTSTLPLLMPVAMPWWPSSPHGNTPHLIPHIKIKCSAAVAAAHCCPGSHRVQLFSAAACQCCWYRYSTLLLSSAAGCCTRDVAAASTTEQRQQQWQEWQRGGSSQAAAAVETAAIINTTLLILSLFQLILRIWANWELSMGPIFSADDCIPQTDSGIFCIPGDSSRFWLFTLAGMYFGNGNVQPTRLYMALIICSFTLHMGCY